MKLNPQQIIIEGDVSITFEEMISFAEEFSQKLNGIKCCAILCKSELLASKALLSCFASNITVLPLSQRYGELHCNKIVDVIRPDAIITDQNGELEVNFIRDSRYVEPKIHPALIMCTSGTSGLPKGVMLTEKNIITNVSDIARYFCIDIDFKTVIPLCSFNR